MKTTPKLSINILTPLACSVLAAVLLTFGPGCASTKQTEDLLTAAGFKTRPATTAAQQEHLKSLPRKVSLLQKDGKNYYVFPDAARNVLYVGDNTQYEEYQKLRKQQAWAEEQVNPAAEMQTATALWGF